MSASSRGSLELDLRFSQKLYERSVVPRFGANGPPSENPKLVIVGGQQGSGKTTTLSAISDGQLRRETTQRVTVDNLMPLVPGYSQAAAKDSIAAQIEVGATPGTWGWQLMERAFEHRFNAVIELASSSAINTIALSAKEHGYRVELVAMAVQRDVSWTSVVSRYERDLSTDNADARFIARNDHDSTYHKWPSGLFAVEAAQIVDSIAVYGRDGALFYDNRLVQGRDGSSNYERAPGAMETMIVQRHRPLDAEQRTALPAAWDTITKSPALAQMLPLLMLDFGTDRSAVTEHAQSDTAKVNLFDARQAISKEAASAWSQRFADDIGQAYAADKEFSGNADFKKRLRTLASVAETLTASAQQRAASSEPPEPSRANNGETNGSDRPPNLPKRGRSR